MLVVVTAISFLVHLYSIQDLKKKLFAFRLKETICGLLTQIMTIKEDKPLGEHLDRECAASDLADSLVIVEPSYNGYYWVGGGFLILGLGLYLYLNRTSGHGGDGDTGDGGDTGQSSAYDSPFIQDNILDSLSLAKAEVIEEPFYESWDTTPGSFHGETSFNESRYTTPGSLDDETPFNESWYTTPGSLGDESPFIEAFNLSASCRQDFLSVSSPEELNFLSSEVQNFYAELTDEELDLICDQLLLSLPEEIAEKWKCGFLTDSEYHDLFDPFLLEAYIRHLELLSL